MTTVWKKWVHPGNLDEIVSNYSNPNRGTIKMWSDDFQLGMYIEYGLRHNDKDPIFKVADHLRISKYKKIFAKGYTANIKTLYNG